MRSLAFVLMLVAAGEAEQDPWHSFVPGTFTLVGRPPEDGLPYTGEAKLESRGSSFVLHRKIGGKTFEAVGKIEVPSPPGEGKVLRFHWQEAGVGRVMACLVSSDLDNYPRLSCLWSVAGQHPQKPGLEAYFSNEGWQD